MKTYSIFGIIKCALFGAILALPVFLFAAAEPQSVKLNLTINDGVKTCKAVVLDENNKPVEGAGVLFFVKRTFGNLPIGKKMETNSEGVAVVEFPKDLPGDPQGKVTVMTQLNDFEELTDEVSTMWGTKVIYDSEITEKSIWASRSNAPTFLVIVSNAIILGIWGTMGYVVYILFFKIRKSGLNVNP